MWAHTFVLRSRLRPRSITLELTRKVTSAYPYFATRYARGPVSVHLLLTVHVNSGSLPSRYHLVGGIDLLRLAIEWFMSLYV